MNHLVFKPFIRSDQSESLIPNQPGSYIICLKSNAHLPAVTIVPVFAEHDGLRVLYTGISDNLRSRNVRHFRGNNAGRSTLRMSLGVLFGYKQVPRDKDPSTGKTKFCDVDEEKLSILMQNNLIFYYCQNSNCLADEQELINKFNPPLNLSKNHNFINSEFRKMISALRRSK